MPSRRQRPTPYMCNACKAVFPSYAAFQRHSDETGHALGWIVPRAKRPGGGR